MAKYFGMTQMQVLLLLVVLGGAYWGTGGFTHAFSLGTAAIGTGGAGGSGTSGGSVQDGAGVCPDVGTSNLILNAQESLLTSTGAQTHVAGTVVSYLDGSGNYFDSSAITDTGGNSATDPSCGTDITSVLQNTSYHLAALTFNAANAPNTQVNFVADPIPTMTVRAKNSTALGVATTINIVMAASSTNTEVALNIQAATARSVIYDPIAAVQYNLENFTSAAFTGKADIPCPGRIGAPATTILNATVVTKCYDLALGKSIKDFAYSPDLYMTIVAKDGVNPTVSGVYVTIMERAPYLLNGVILTGAETNALVRPTYSASDATFTINVA